MSGLTELEKELLEALKYVRRFVKPADVDTAYIDEKIARAEAKAKEPQCVCAIGSFNGAPLCGRKFVQSPVHYLGEFCGNTAPCGSKCGHDRACHSSAVEG